MRGHRVGELGIVLDLGDRADHFRRDLFVELHVVVELGHHRARHRLHLHGVGDHVGNALHLGLVDVGPVAEALDLGAGRTLHQHLHGAIRQLQQLQHGRQRADGINGLDGRVVVLGILLGRQQNVLVVAHHLFEGADRLFAPHEQGHDHVREDDDVAQRQNRHDLRPAIGGCRRKFGTGVFVRGHEGPSFLSHGRFA